MSKTSNDEWFTEDQAQWWDDQKRDEEELQQMREEEMRDEIMDEVIAQFKEDYWPKIVERLQDEALEHGRYTYRLGFIHGFIAAMLGALLFFYFY